MTLGRRKSDSPKQVPGAPAVGRSMLVWSEFVSSSSVSGVPAGRREENLELEGKSWTKEKFPLMQVHRGCAPRHQEVQGGSAVIQ